MKSPAEDHFRNEIKLARELSKYIVLAGCVPQGQPKADYMQVYVCCKIAENLLSEKFTHPQIQTEILP